MHVLDYEGLNFYDQKLKEYLINNFSTDTKATIAINTAKEAKAIFIENHPIPCQKEEIDNLFIEESSDES